MNYRSQQVVRIIPENWYGTVAGDDVPLIVDGQYAIVLFPEFTSENNGKICIWVNPENLRNQYE